MKATNFSDSELQTKVNYLFSVAEEWRVVAAAYLQNNYGTRDDKYRIMKLSASRLMAEAYDLIHSGQLPWVVENGLGNNCDVTARKTEVIARRVFDTFTAENDLSDFGGRAIELTVTVSEERGGTQHTLVFRDPMTVQRVIEQLQQELDGWDDWDGGSYEF